ncbi:hypothetical protein ACFYNL_05860 [Streptomyces sp. NPDC007808]|uniref:hypothetical protein n=1 Tax=Streptomyces sp. NPDC007808 TaxID=3364779 RepID=UPI0036B71804
MKSFSGSPRIFRGAVVAVDPTGPFGHHIAFQYNPDQVTRKLQPRGLPEPRAVAPTDAGRLYGAPVETVSLTMDIDATDQLEQGDAMAATTGIAPQLAALELLLHPRTAAVVERAALLLAGTMEILPPEAPLTLLIWGPGRAVPIRIESLSVTEQAFDPLLFPTRATVELSAHVLSYNDLPVGHPGYALYLVHQVMRETMAAAAVGSAQT